MCMNFRNNFSRLAENLLNKGERDSCTNVLDKMNVEMPDKTVPYNVMMLRPIELYYRSAMNINLNPMDTALNSSSVELPGQKRKQVIETANLIVKRMADIYEDDLNYYFSLKGTEYIKFVDRDMNQAMAVFQELIRLAKTAGQKDIVKNLEPRFNSLEKRFTAGK